MRVARLVTLGLTLGLASGALAGSPDQDRALAKQHFEAGSLRFDLAEYEQALIEFKEAYRFKPDAMLLYNIAQCHRKLGHVDEALTFYRNYRRRAPGAANREEIERRISELEAEQQARKAKQLSEAKERNPVSPPAPQVLPVPPPIALDRPVTSVGSPAAANRTDLTQSADRPEPDEATSETSIVHRWWFWTAIGVVVAGGVTGVLLATRGGGNGPFCSDCTTTSGVNAK